MNKAFLLPGKIAVVKGACELTTVLGSCVAVALHDESAGITGLNHYLLPSARSGDIGGPRYGTFAIPELIREMEALGASTIRMKAKIYGGAEILSSVSTSIQVGKRNVDLAKKVLEENNIYIVEKNVGGELSRKIRVTSPGFQVSMSLGSRTSTDMTGLGTLKMAKNVSVGIVDDSAAVRAMFHKMFTQHGLKVVGTAANAYEAREMIVNKKPEVITLDIEMPKMNGVAFLEKIMTHMPIPVVMVSSLSRTGEAAARALELGAVEFIQKPSQSDPLSLRTLGEMLANKVRSAASVDVSQVKTPAKARKKGSYATSVNTGQFTGTVDLVVIGGNAGSHQALGEVLSTLASDTPPVVVANPTLAPLVQGFIGSQKKRAQVEIFEATDNTSLSLGSVYLVPAGVQPSFEVGRNGIVLRLRSGQPVCGQMPSVTALFSSVAQAGWANRCVAVLLGGFGQDGVDGIDVLERKGAMTIIQDPAECLFPHGPQMTLERGLGKVIVSAQDIAQQIFEYRNQRIVA